MKILVSIWEKTFARRATEGCNPEYKRTLWITKKREFSLLRMSNGNKQVIFIVGNWLTNTLSQSTQPSLFREIQNKTTVTPSYINRLTKTLNAIVESRNSLICCSWKYQLGQVFCRIPLANSKKFTSLIL